MLFKRIVAGCCIATLLSGCTSVTVRGGESANFWSEYRSCDGGSSPRMIPKDDGDDHYTWGGGGGEIEFAFALVVVTTVGIFLAGCEGIDHVQRLSKPPQPGAIQDGIYHAPYSLYTVSVPGEFAPDGPTDLKVHELTSQDQEQVFFMPQAYMDASYAVSVIPNLPTELASMPLAEFAARVAPVPAPKDQSLSSWGAGFTLLHEEKVVVDGRPAIFRVYGEPTTRYLLYIIKIGKESALLSVTWHTDCPKCAAGPESDIRAMDPHLKRFVESFHLSTAPAGA